MRTSFCSIALRDDKIKFIIPQVAETGYDGIEVWGQHLVAFLEQGGTVKQLKKLTEEHKLEIPAISPVFNFTGSEAEKKESVRLGKKFVNFSEELGKPVIRVFTGNKGSAEATDDDWKQCAGALQELCEYAQPRGICFALETHPLNLMDDVPATLRLLDMVNFPNLRVIYDIWHVFCEGRADPVKALDDLYPYIIHVHAKNRKQKAKGPRGTNTRYLDNGDLDFKPVLTALKQRKYKGFISIEWFGIDRSAVWDAAEHELLFLKQFCK